MLLTVIGTAIIVEAKAKPEASPSYNLPTYESHHGATYYDESINIEGNIFRPNVSFSIFIISILYNFNLNSN